MDGLNGVGDASIHGRSVMKLRIKNWDRHFENDRSRRVDKCSFVCIPNSLGQGMKNLMALESFLPVFAIFILIVEECSKHPKPRNGYLTRGGRENGEPWTYDDIAGWYGLDRTDVEAYFSILMSSKVGWIEDLDTNSPPTHHALTTNSLHKEGRNGRNEGKKHSVPLAGDGAPRVCDPELTDSDRVQPFTPGFLLAWQSFPGPGRDRSCRRDSFRVWESENLETKTDKVLAAIAAWKSSEQWTRDGGQYVPALHRWLKRRKWTEPPQVMVDGPTDSDRADATFKTIYPSQEEILSLDKGQ